jgi:D-beta-D-heptose 7-phosphate kinase/D-beta-D-heptose 1-phosphate adenosyltransferase
MKVVVVSGGFDPVHSGHLSYFNAARQLGDKLVVGLNSDSWLCHKKGKAFMPLQERSKIIQSFKMVDYVMFFDDSDGSARKLLKLVKQTFPQEQIIFANGGDRTKENIPEMDVDGVEFIFGVGGENKTNSSSSILQDWKEPKTERPWGYWRVLYHIGNTKVKELVVNSGQSLSMQRHQFRNEYWHIVEGEATVKLEYTPNEIRTSTIYKNHHFSIPLGVWHQLINNGTEQLKIIEIQHGEKCEEDDIERKMIMEMPGTIGSAKIIFEDKE